MIRELWTENDWLMSKVIKWLFEEDCSHYSLEFTSVGFIIQSNLFGVGPDYSKTFHSHQRVVHSIDHEVSFEDEQKIMKDLLDKYDNYPYDWKAIPYILWRGLLKKYFNIPLPKKGHGGKGIFCHEMRQNMNPYLKQQVTGDLSCATPHMVYEMIKESK